MTVVFIPYNFTNASLIASKVNQSRYRPGQAQRVLKEITVPRFRDNGTGCW